MEFYIKHLQSIKASDELTEAINKHDWLYDQVPLIKSQIELETDSEAKAKLVTKLSDAIKERKSILNTITDLKYNMFVGELLRIQNRTIFSKRSIVDKLDAFLQCEVSPDSPLLDGFKLAMVKSARKWLNEELIPLQKLHDHIESCYNQFVREGSDNELFFDHKQSSHHL